jgi:hypothetical protein
MSKRLWQTLAMSLLVLYALPGGQLQVTTGTSSLIVQTSATIEATSGPSIDAGSITTNLADYPNRQVPRYAKLEIAFVITRTAASNPYFPYDPDAPQGVPGTTGIRVDAWLLPPGETDWKHAMILPCFYYQPVEEVGDGDQAALLPAGEAGWRCRFTPEVTGTWQYKLRATDAAGTTETQAFDFTCVSSNRNGFVRTGVSDYRFFEFSDGSPLVMPLVNLEQSSPFNRLADIRADIQKLGENGVRFVRWFPTGEGANFFVAPFGDSMRINWGFGDGQLSTDAVDTPAGKRFSFRPYYYSAQDVPVVAGSRYRLTFRARVAGEQVLRAQIGDLPGGSIDICSSASTFHPSRGKTCNYRQNGWRTYSIQVRNTRDTTLSVALRGLYVSPDAPSPYNSRQAGDIGIHSVQFQRDETGDGDWGPNLLMRSDPDTHNYVDQRAAASLDEVFRLSEKYGVYHKLPLFHKNDEVLNRLLADGSVGDWDPYSRNFYSAEQQASRWHQFAYARYFIARWSYSPALHSLELANENHLTQESYEAGFALAEYVRRTSSRHILMSNSFWGYWVSDFWTDPQRGHLLDYSDKHWYARVGSTDPEVISTIWSDSAAYVRECRDRFQEYAESHTYHKPIVRGEGGVWGSDQGQHRDIRTDPQGTYYHKKLWSHVGLLGYSCDGEWYPRLFEAYQRGQFPNDRVDLLYMFAAYENFMRGEGVNNGQHQEVGTDLTGNWRISLAHQTGSLRAWGVRDSSRVLLWIDNARHTWKNVADRVTIRPASATLTIPGFRPGEEYLIEWWDTHPTDLGQQIIGAERRTAQPDGVLTIKVDNLVTDIAVKIAPPKVRSYLPMVVSP